MTQLLQGPNLFGVYQLHHFKICLISYRWDQESVCFFPVLYQNFSSHPNVTLIAITTGVRPYGKKTVYLQASSDNEGYNIEITLNQQTQMQSLHHALQIEATCYANTLSFKSSFDIFSHNSSADFLQSSHHDKNEKENAPPPSSQPISTLVLKRPPKALLLSQGSIKRAKQHISKVPKKLSLDEPLINIQTWIESFLCLLPSYTIS